MIIVLIVFFIIAIVGLVDLNKRVHELEEQQKQREDIDETIKRLLEDLSVMLEDGGKNEPIR